jgi:hypothetical protein
VRLVTPLCLCLTAWYSRSTRCLCFFRTFVGVAWGGNRLSRLPLTWRVLSIHSLALPANAITPPHLLLAPCPYTWSLHSNPLKPTPKTLGVIESTDFLEPWAGLPGMIYARPLVAPGDKVRRAHTCCRGHARIVAATCGVSAGHA